MICKKCGLQNAEGNRFCIVCGNPLEEKSEVAINQNVEISQKLNVQIEEEKGVGIDIFNHPMTEIEQNNTEMTETLENNVISETETSSILNSGIPEMSIPTPKIDSSNIELKEETSTPSLENNVISETETPSILNSGIPEMSIPTSKIDSSNIELKEETFTLSLENNAISETETSSTLKSGVPEMNTPSQKINSMNEGFENQEITDKSILVEENRIANHDNLNQTIENIENYISQENSDQQNNAEIKSSEIPLKDKSSKSVHYFSIIGKFLGRPISTIQEQINNFTMKDSAITMGLISIIAVLLNFIVQAINTIKETTIDWNNGGTTIEWNFENLKELNYIDILLKNWAYTLIVILVLTIIYYVVALFARRKIKIYPILGLISLSILPTVVTTFVLFPIIGEFSPLIAIIILIIGFVYSNLILILGTNEIVGFEKLDSKIYYQLVCAILISIIVCLILSETINTLSSMLSLA